MRIAIDIDSTLHHYWDELARSAKRRFGVELPYDQQRTWEISRLRKEQFAAVLADTHSDDAITRAEPYPYAVETINAWHAAGHDIYVMSHRSPRCEPATATWLAQIGLSYDELHCSSDKLARCAEVGIDVLIDDSPVTLAAAVDAGIVGATLKHPWNQDLCEEEDIIAGRDWRELAAALERRFTPLRRVA